MQYVSLGSRDSIFDLCLCNKVEDAYAICLNKLELMNAMFKCLGLFLTILCVFHYVVYMHIP